MLTEEKWSMRFCLRVPLLQVFRLKLRFGLGVMLRYRMAMLVPWLSILGLMMLLLMMMTMMKMMVMMMVIIVLHSGGGRHLRHRLRAGTRRNLLPLMADRCWVLESACWFFCREHGTLRLKHTPY